MSCELQRWPQSRWNTASITPSGDLRWIRWWDPMRVLHLNGLSGTTLFTVVTDSLVNVVYRDTSNNWFLSSLNSGDGSPHLEHVNLGYSDALSNIQLGFISYRPPVRTLRNEIFIGQMSDGGQRARLVHINANTGTLTTTDSDAVTDISTPGATNGPIIEFTTSGELVMLHSDDTEGRGALTVLEGTGELFREYPDDPSIPNFSGHIAPDPGGFELVFLAQNEWWRIDNATQTVEQVVEDDSFTAGIASVPPAAAFSPVSSNRVWIFDNSAGNNIQLRKIDDDTDDVVLSVVPSDFDDGTHSFSSLTLRDSLNRNMAFPGWNIDSSGRLFVSAQGGPSSARRTLAVSESDVRVFSDTVNQETSGSTGGRSEIVATGSGTAVRSGNWDPESSDVPRPSLSSALLNIRKSAEGLVASTGLENTFTWRGLRDYMLPTRDSAGNLFFVPPSESFSSFYNSAIRILDVASVDE